MLIALVLFIFGIVLLLLSTQFFIKLAERISTSLKMSSLVIGLTVVSIGTSLPELVVSVVAVANHDAGLAMGNIIGSNIVNVFLVFAVGILTGKLRVGTIKTQRNIYIMAGITGLFLLLYFFGVSSRMAGAILLFFALLITLEQYAWGVNGRSHEDGQSYKRMGRASFQRIDIGKLFFVLVGIVLGGIITVSSVEQLSSLLGLSTTLLGLSITAIATSIPELMTTIFSQKNHEEKITIGNIIGSNIYNLALVGGILLFFSSWKIMTAYEIFMLITSTLSFTAVVILNKGGNIPKYIGMFLFCLFIAYIYFLR